jgi:hypothetical protein
MGAVRLGGIYCTKSMAAHERKKKINTEFIATSREFPDTAGAVLIDGANRKAFTTRLSL